MMSITQNYDFLDKIHSLEDFKKIDKKDYPILTKEIREFLIDHVSKTGGHLAPNLGVVELTVALHHVFHSPDDKIIFDVGHQCYVHKILTGRAHDFSTLRQAGGISGFPRINESIHDVVSSGHSSTSISTALGIATANKLAGKNDYTIAVIGDGALTGGMAFEALNNAQIDNTNLIVVLNDNQMSISPSVGNLSLYLNKIRSNNFYTESKRNIRNFLKHVPLIGNPIMHLIEYIKNAIRHLAFPNSVLFEQFGFTYLGPIDGHNLDELIKMLNRSKSVKKPVLLHVITKKGKGYAPAEQNPDIFHGIGKFDKETGTSLSKSSEGYSHRFGEELIKLAEKNDKIVAITAAMPGGTGLNPFREKFPERFFDVGIAEEHATTFAGGLALGGYIPFFAVYSTFLQRAYDQIIHDVALQNAHVIFAIDRAGIVGADGETHQGIFDLSYLSHIPNLCIMAPKDGDELAKMMKFAISYNGPVVIRYPRDGYIKELAKPHKNTPSLSSMKAEILKKGKDVTIIGYGKTVSTAINVAKLLKENQIEAEVINARFLKPLDRQTILKSIQKTKKLVTIEDNIIHGGLASCINDSIKDEHILWKKFFAYPDEFIPQGTTSEIEKKYGLDAESIANEIIKNIKK